MTSIALRPRSGSEIVDVSVQLLKANYATLVTITAVTWLPVVLFQLLYRAELSDPAAAQLHFVITILTALLQGLALLVADGASIIAVSDMYLGGRTGASAALARVGPRLMSLIGANIMRNILGALATLFLIIPGIYVLVRSFTLPVIVMLEGDDASEAWNRAWALGEDNVGQIFWPVAAAAVLYTGLGWAMLYYMTRLGYAVPVLRTSGVVLVVGNLGSVIFHPIMSVVRTAVYYDLRVRKEGFDVEVMANELDAPAVS